MTIRKYSVIAFFVLLGLYSLFQARSIILGPELSIESPKANSSLPAGAITVVGTAKNISFLTLDDRQIYTDPTGHFEEELVMQPGINIIKLGAKDRFGREKVLLVQVLAEPNAQNQNQEPNIQNGTSTGAVQ